MQTVLHERRREYEALPKSRRESGMRSDPYLNALQVKYGYAVTGHKAQGGQWRNVIVGFEPLYPGMAMTDYLRWAYTAMTRAEERLYLLNFPFVQREF
jgi:exodeoxyribonuclease-5